MSPSRRRTSTAAAVVVALGLPAVAGAASDAGPPASLPVIGTTYPILDLDLPVASLDGSISRSDDASGTRITLSADILFAFDRATLSSRARSRLDDVAAQVRAARPRTVRIEGYTDDEGAPGYNLRLSRRRAQTVRAALRDAFGGARVVVVGRGEADPVVSNTTKDGQDSPKGRARNRRVEIRLPRTG